MEEALGADGHGFLEQHDALIGLVADELQGGEAAGRRHVEMLPTARGYDKAFCCAHLGVLPCGGMRINTSTMNINVHESRSSPARSGRSVRTLVDSPAAMSEPADRLGRHPYVAPRFARP